MVLLNLQRIFGGTGLNGSQIELMIREFFFGNGDFPGFLQNWLIGILSNGENLFELKGQGFLVFGFTQKSVEANVAQFFMLVPELGGLIAKT